LTSVGGVPYSSGPRMMFLIEKSNWVAGDDAGADVGAWLASVAGIANARVKSSRAEVRIYWADPA